MAIKNALIIGFVWPEPNTTAAGSRMLQFITLLLEQGYFITFVSTATKTDRSENLEKLGIASYNIALNDSSFDDFIKKNNPEIVVFDRFLTEEQFGWRVAEACPKAIKILDTEDLHFLRKAREKAWKEKESINLSNLQNDICKREIASIYRCDLTLIISKFELNLLLLKFNIPSELLLYLPFLVDAIGKKTMSSYPIFEERVDFMTIGNFKHEPNWNAVLYLKNTIWPLIRKELPNVNLIIYGAYGDSKVNQLHNTSEGFLCKGWIENKKEAFTKARVCLAPLNFGAGLKGKLLDAMIYGTPSVTTSIGAEGMHKNLPWNGAIENHTNQFAKKAVQLYSNKEDWLAAQNNAIPIINQCFQKGKFEKLLTQRIHYLKNHLDQIRNRNTTGNFLTHQYLMGTKYLSKWIESKNAAQ